MVTLLTRETTNQLGGQAHQHWERTFATIERTATSVETGITYDRRRRTQRGGYFEDFRPPAPANRQATPSTTTSIGFLTRDPIGFDGGAYGIYEYCHTKPHIYMDPFGKQIMPPSIGAGYPIYMPAPHQPPSPPAPPIRLTTLCAGINACPDCDPTVCAAAQKEIQDAFNAANGAAIGTLDGWLEEHGVGSYGGRCHYWSGMFCKDLNCKPVKRGSCLNVTGHIIRLDGGSHWVDHNVNVIKNRCSGKCTVVDDGFWGTLGQVYDPCNVPNPPLVGPIGQGQWDSIRAGCGCAGGTGGGTTR